MALHCLMLQKQGECSCSKSVSPTDVVNDDGTNQNLNGTDDGVVEVFGIHSKPITSTV